MSAPLGLVLARARRRPGRWLLPALGIGVAAAFLAGVAAEGTVAGDQAARSVLMGLSPLNRVVRVTVQGARATAVPRRLLAGLPLGPQTEVVLLNPVRLSGVVVRPAAIAPLDRWLPTAAARRLGRCEPRRCPMLLAGGGHVPVLLSAAGVRITMPGESPLASAVPLAFSPVTAGSPPVLVTGDVAGLDAVPGLSGLYRTHNWVAALAVGGLHSWQLGSVERRLVSAQAELQVTEGEVTLSGPFDGLAEARAQADAAPRRLLLAGGAAIAVLVLFVLLAGAGLRRDQLEELARLRNAGARSGQRLLFVLAECGWLAAAALIAGGAVGVLSAAIIASSAGEPVGGVLANSLLTPVAALALAAAWLLATGLMTVSALARSERLIDVVAVLALVGLAVGLLVAPGENRGLAFLLAPLCCLAAGVGIFRVAAELLRVGERVLREGPLRARLAVVSLARAPSLPSAAIAFVAVSVGLGGFALAYRATLLRGAADQAADAVPLDALVAPGANFKTPFELAPPARWHALAGAKVLTVRRTEASYESGAASVTVPALGVPARALPSLHGWRASDGSAPLAVLARRLRSPGRVRVPGPGLSVAARWLSLRASAEGGGAVVLAVLRDATGNVTQLVLGTAGPRPAQLRARLPAGRFELEGLELQVPTGLEATNGHQLAENPAGVAQEQIQVNLGAVRALTGAGRTVLRASMAGWRAVGAATPAASAPGGAGIGLVFAITGQPGVLRPAQPSDTRPVPVLVDPQTDATAAPGGRLSLTIDGLPVKARVAGVLRRFPTLPADTAGFLVADEPTLTAALDAELPGQGRPDELWLTTTHPARLRAALARPPFSQLSAAFRSELEHRLRDAPLARGVLGTLIAASIVTAVLGVLGLLVALLGPARDHRVERDLAAQGIGPRGLRTELRARIAVSGGLGASAGLVIALLLVRLAVITVRAAGAVANPRPGLVTVVPWLELAAWGVGAALVLMLAGVLATRGAR